MYHGIKWWFMCTNSEFDPTIDSDSDGSSDGEGE